MSSQISRPEPKGGRRRCIWFRLRLRDRTVREARAFVKGLSGAHAELYDYLAEEVIGELPDRPPRFLDAHCHPAVGRAEQAAIVTGLDPRAVSDLIAESERLGLLSGRHERKRRGHSYHPLVREFLEARLRREVGDDALVDISQERCQLGRVARLADCVLPLRSFGRSRRPAPSSRGVNREHRRNGRHRPGSRVRRSISSEHRERAFEIVRSRLAASIADVRAAVDHAKRAVAIDEHSDAANGNLLGTYFAAGELEPASALAARLASSAQTSVLRDVGAATWQILDVTLEGDINRGHCDAHGSHRTEPPTRSQSLRGREPPQYGFDAPGARGCG